MSALVEFSNGLAAAVERAGRGIVAVHARPRTPSSGVLWRSGVVVTTDHTTERDEEITVTLPGGETVAATLQGRDPSTDLAVLKLPVETGTAEVADAPLQVGHMALALGRGVTAALGVISSLDGAWRTWRGGSVDRFIRLDVAIYHGFSGGALVTADGRIAGVNTSALARGAAVAIPVETVNRVVDDLLRHGRVARGYLGVGMQPVRGGVIVLSVEPDSPAARGGLLVGDVLVAIDESAVRDTDDVQAVLDPSRVGKTVPVRVIRAGAEAGLSITIGERPKGA
ncbi:MAG: PDZ domain-containing protein [Bryobacterales bacterium]|nr:PDZ domain-containing protein [Bryobacterales bacterium]